MIPADLNPEMLVADVIHDWPQGVPIFLQLRMACVGCDLAAFCTLEEAARDYHLPIDVLITRLQHTIHFENNPARQPAG